MLCDKKNMIRDLLDRINAKHYVNKCFRHDARRYRAYSCPLEPGNERQLSAAISIKCHVLEKGLSMPGMRLAFGQKNIRELVDLCLLYKNQYGAANPRLLQAVAAIKEYDHIHKQQNCSLESLTTEKLEALQASFEDVAASEQPQTNRMDYFSHSADAFDVFSASRHSVRCFSDEPVAVDTLKEAVALAMNAPSACNRQSQQVHIVQDKKLVGRILSLQNGCRGFAERVDKLLVLTFDLSFYGDGRSRNLGYMDSGIFAMNLLYALHFHKVGACPLNWCDSPKDDKAIRKVLNLRPEETVTLIIACGHVPSESFRRAESKRLDPACCMTIHE